MRGVTRLVARLVLAMLLLPLSGAVFIIGFALISGPRGPSSRDIVWLWLALYAFIGVYWLLLWVAAVRWTPIRIVLSVLSVPLAIACGGGFGLLLLEYARIPTTEVVFLFAGGVPPIVWVLATVLIWRETQQEHRARLAALGHDSVSCPVCGYNLTGLREARCPECGTSFTLDQLLGAGPVREEAAGDG